MDLAYPDGTSGGWAGQGTSTTRTSHGAHLPRRCRRSRGRGEDFHDVLIWIGADPRTRRALSVSARSIRDGGGVSRGRAGLPGRHGAHPRHPAQDKFVGPCPTSCARPSASAMASSSSSTSRPSRAPPAPAGHRQSPQRDAALAPDRRPVARHPRGAGSSLVDPYRWMPSRWSPRRSTRRGWRPPSPTSPSRSSCPTARRTGRWPAPEQGRGQPRGERHRLHAAPRPRHGHLAAEASTWSSPSPTTARHRRADLDSVYERFYRGRTPACSASPAPGSGSPSSAPSSTPTVARSTYQRPGSRHRVRVALPR